MAEAVVLENQFMRLVVVPEQGARVTSMIDKKSGREWLFAGRKMPLSPRIEASFGGDECGGWDECFPTMSPVFTGSTAWRRPLRDHGELWGRPWTVEEANTLRLTTRIARPEFTFVRTLELNGPSLECIYEVMTVGRTPLPFLWAQHALLSVTPKDRVVMPGIKLVDAVYMSVNGEERLPQTFSWPGPGGVLGIPLDVVHPPDRRLAAKFYTRAQDTPLASVGNEEGWLDFTWDAQEVPYIGLWVNYGEWPQTQPLHHLAIEPSTAPVDSIEDAIAMHRRRLLTRNQPFVWSVNITMRRGAVASAA